MGQFFNNEYYDIAGPKSFKIHGKVPFIPNESTSDHDKCMDLLVLEALDTHEIHLSLVTNKNKILKQAQQLEREGLK